MKDACDGLIEDNKDIRREVTGLKKDVRLILFTIVATNALWALWTVAHHFLHS